MTASALKDIAVLFDGSADAVQDAMTGIALCLSHHDGARLTEAWFGGTSMDLLRNSGVPIPTSH
jgi:hypothetical protein